MSVTEILPPEYSWLEKFHGSDVALLFSLPTWEVDGPDNPFTAELYTFANYFRGVIGKFVRNPAGGPGWPQVQSSYEPLDIAILGDVGDVRTSGATPANTTEVDDRCFLYKDIYPVIEQYVL